jgi:hypothetical protein
MLVFEAELRHCCGVRKMRSRYHIERDFAHFVTGTTVAWGVRK